MPDGAVYVGRPTIFGNPFAQWTSPAELFGWWLRGVEGKQELLDRLCHKTQPLRAEFVVEQLMTRRLVLLSRLSDLRGKDLACWCSVGKTCHADVLLELANR